MDELKLSLGFRGFVLSVSTTSQLPHYALLLAGVHKLEFRILCALHLYSTDCHHFGGLGTHQIYFRFQN